MKQRYIIATLLVTAIGGMTASALAAEPTATSDAQNPGVAESAQPTQDHSPPAGWPWPGPHMMAFGEGGPMPPFGPPGGFPHGPNPALELAGKLSAMETLIGIRSTQLDAWRDYTNALTDLLAFPGHRPPGQPEASDEAASQPARGTGDQADGRKELFGERIADRVLDRAAKATILKDKATALRNVLTADQVAKLEDAERSLVPGPHMFR